MNKIELSKILGLSLVTLTRYISMGMPFQKDGSKYDFNIDEVEKWIDDNIDRRQPEDRLPPMTKKEAMDGLYQMAVLFFEHVDIELLKLHAEGKCPVHHKNKSERR